MGESRERNAAKRASMRFRAQGRRGAWKAARRAMHVAALSLASMLFGLPAPAATLPPGFELTLHVSGLSVPTAMAFTPDGRLLVAEKGGALRVVAHGSLLPEPFVTLTVASDGEQGLVGVAVDPNFASNHFVYLHYTATTPTLHNRVSRFTADGNVAQPGSELPLLDLEPLTAIIHNGGGIQFGQDGKLYIGVGDNGNRSNAQSLETLKGKILRIDPDGGIPDDNPVSFGGTTGTTSGPMRAIWAIGLRNPFSSSFDRCEGRYYINDVGEGSMEEIDRGSAGANFGWPDCEGRCEAKLPGRRNPIYQYPHASESGWSCAITGGAFYQPEMLQFPAFYRGAYFFADWCGDWIQLLTPALGTSVSFVREGPTGIVDLDVGDDGALYLLTLYDGSIWKIAYPAAAPPDEFRDIAVQDGNFDMEYGGWRGSRDAGASGGSFRTSRTAGDTATFTFGGPYIAFLARKGPDQGKALVTIDGEVRCECDFYSDSPNSAFVRTFTGLGAGLHRIVVRVLGEKNALATDRQVAIDAFVTANGTIEEDEIGVSLGGWTLESACPAFGGTWRTSAKKEASLGMEFCGDRIAWVYAAGPNKGMARVFIDGADMGLVDQWAPVTEPRTRMPFDHLGEGTHRIEVIVLGRKRAQSGGTSVTHDAFLANTDCIGPQHSGP